MQVRVGGNDRAPDRTDRREGAFRSFLSKVTVSLGSLLHTGTRYHEGKMEKNAARMADLTASPESRAAAMEKLLRHADALSEKGSNGSDATVNRATTALNDAIGRLGLADQALMRKTLAEGLASGGAIDKAGRAEFEARAKDLDKHFSDSFGTKLGTQSFSEARQKADVLHATQAKVGLALESGCAAGIDGRAQEAKSFVRDLQAGTADPRLSAVVLRFAQKEHNDENVRACNAINDFKAAVTRGDDDAARAKFAAFRDEFLLSSSPSQLNLKRSDQTAISQIDQSNLRVDTFDMIKQTLGNNLNDLMARVLVSADVRVYISHGP